MNGYVMFNVTSNQTVIKEGTPLFNIILGPENDKLRKNYVPLQLDTAVLEEKLKNIDIQRVFSTQERVATVMSEYVKHLQDVPNVQKEDPLNIDEQEESCLLYTSPSPRDRTRSRMPSSA